VLYRDGVGHEGSVFYCFVARATLGAAIFTADGENSLHSPHQPIYVSSDKRELSVIPGSVPSTHYHALVAEAGKGHKVERHREFIIFEGDRVQLEYLLAFQRC